MLGRRSYRGAPPSPSQVTSAAREACKGLESIGVKPCFVGGLACKLHGNYRQPNDIDILCLATHLGQEELKRQLVAYNSNFYVVPSRDPNATYKVLWYRFPSTGSSVKVDILLPGVMDIPNIATSRIDYGASGGRELPVAPLSLVFLLKLQAWSQHRASSISRFYQKQYTDHSDITHLLPVLAMKGIKPNEESYLPTSFRDEAVRRVREYTRQYPESISNWRNIGYDVAPLPSVVRSTVVRRVYNGTPTRISLSSRVESWLDAYD